MKKFSALFLCLLILVGLFSGCGADTADTSASSVPAEAQQPVEEAAGPAEEAPEKAPEAAPDAAGNEPDAPQEPEQHEAVPEQTAAEAGSAEALTIQDALRIADSGIYTLPLAEDTVFSVYAESAPPFAQSYLGDDGSYNSAASTLYIKELTGITIEFHEIDMFSYSEKFNLMLASGSYTDLFTGLGTYTAEQAWLDDVIIDMTDYVENSMPVRSALIEAFGLGADDYNEDGRILGIKGIALGAQAPRGLTIRADWLEELQMDMPQTYDELHEVALAMKDAHNMDHVMFFSTTVNPGIAMSAGYDLPAFDMTASGSSLYIKDRRVHCAYTEENFKEYLRMLGEWFGEGLINHDFYNTVHSDGKDRFLNSEFGFYWDNANFITEDNTIITLQEPGFRAEAGPFMLKEEGQVLHFGAGQALSLGKGIYVSTACDETDTLVRFADFMFGPDGILLTNYGMQVSDPADTNGTYYLDADGLPVFTDYMARNPEGVSFMTITIPYLQNVMPTVVDNHKFDSVSMDADGVYATQLWTTGFETDSAYDFYGTLYLTEEETTAFNIAMSDVETAASEFILKAIVNETDIDTEWDAYVEKLYSMGLQNALDARQAALDRYYARTGE